MNRRFSLFCLISVLFVLLSSCTFFAQPSAPTIAPSPMEQPSPLLTTSTPTPTPQNTQEHWTNWPLETPISTNNITPTIKISPTPTPSPTNTIKISPTVHPTQTPPISPSPKWDTKVLDTIPNTPVGFGVSLNTQHIPPEISAKTIAIFEKYDAIYLGDSKSKQVILTFDLGYENGYTGKILDALKTKGKKAIFFVTESYVKNNKALVQRMIDEGHEIGNHTSTHPDLTTCSYAKLYDEVAGFGQRFYTQFGVKMRYIRPPQGMYSPRTLAACQMMGYHTVLWSFAYKDWDVNNQKGATYAYNMVMDHLHNGSLLLLHGVSKDNADALPDILTGMANQGYQVISYVPLQSR